jgi:Ala-tRNA(Pro) deacylase
MDEHWRRKRTMATPADVINYLSDNTATFRVLTHVPLYSSQDLARAHHVMNDEVAEYTLFKADHRFVLAVMPAGSVVSEPDLRRVLQARELKKASMWDTERLFPGCELGAAPLLGNLFGLTVVADSTFEKHGRIVFHVCNRATSIMINWRDYKFAVDPIVAAIVEEPVMDQKKAKTQRMITEPA